MTPDDFRQQIQRLSDKLASALQAIERRNEKTLITFARNQDANNRTLYIQPPPERE
jgi:hypothetical protein